MPNLTVRAMAELIRLPAHNHLRILRAQKYPKQAPQLFQAPYYQAALTGIRNYHKAGNDDAQLAAAMGKIQAIALESRRQNNARVLQAFKKCDMSGRLLQPLVSHTVKAQQDTVELRLSPDMRAIDKEKERLILMNCRAEKLDHELALITEEVAFWVLEQNKIKLPIAQIEYVDFFTGQTYIALRRRAATTKALLATVKVIEAIWPTL